VVPHLLVIEVAFFLLREGLRRGRVAHINACSMHEADEDKLLGIGRLSRDEDAVGVDAEVKVLMVLGLVAITGIDELHVPVEVEIASFTKADHHDIASTKNHVLQPFNLVFRCLILVDALSLLILDEFFFFKLWFTRIREISPHLVKVETALELNNSMNDGGLVGGIPFVIEPEELDVFWHIFSANHSAFA